MCCYLYHFEYMYDQCSRDNKHKLGVKMHFYGEFSTDNLRALNDLTHKLVLLKWMELSYFSVD